MRSERGSRTEILRSAGCFAYSLVALTIVKLSAHDSRSELRRQTKWSGVVAREIFAALRSRARPFVELSRIDVGFVRRTLSARSWVRSGRPRIVLEIPSRSARSTFGFVSQGFRVARYRFQQASSDAPFGMLGSLGRVPLSGRVRCNWVRSAQSCSPTAAAIGFVWSVERVDADPELDVSVAGVAFLFFLLPSAHNLRRKSISHIGMIVIKRARLA